MREKYRIKENIATRKRVFIKNHVYKLDTILGEKLIVQGIAEHFTPPMVDFKRADGNIVKVTPYQYQKLMKEFKRNSQINNEEVKNDG
jgi:hypothetical protein